MSDLARKQYFFTWEEFGLCRAAAGIDGLCCYAAPPLEDPSVEGLMGTVFSLIQRGHLAEGPDGFVLSGEAAVCFQQMGQAETVLFICRREYTLPVCLLYGGTEGFVSVQPGRRPGEYVGFSFYGSEEIPEWMEDFGFRLEGNIPDDLLSAVQDDGSTALQGAEVLDFLVRSAWPADRSPEWSIGVVPEEIPWYIESRRASDGQLVATLYLVRQPLFDQIVTGTERETVQRLYQPGTLAELLGKLLEGEDS